MDGEGVTFLEPRTAIESNGGPCKTFVLGARRSPYFSFCRNACILIVFMHVYAYTCIVCDYSCYAFVHVLLPLSMYLCTCLSVLISVHVMYFSWQQSPDLEQTVSYLGLH